MGFRRHTCINKSDLKHFLTAKTAIRTWLLGAGASSIKICKKKKKCTQRTCNSSVQCWLILEGLKANNKYFENAQNLLIYPKSSAYRWTNTDDWLWAPQSYTRKCPDTQYICQIVLLGVTAYHRETSGLFSFGVPEKRWSEWGEWDRIEEESLIWTLLLSRFWLI